jgi:hypothetical protein
VQIVLDANNTRLCEDTCRKRKHRIASHRIACLVDSVSKRPSPDQAQANMSRLAMQHQITPTSTSTRRYTYKRIRFRPIPLQAPSALLYSSKYPIMQNWFKLRTSNCAVSSAPNMVSRRGKMSALTFHVLPLKSKLSIPSSSSSSSL